VTGVQTCALPIWGPPVARRMAAISDRGWRTNGARIATICGVPGHIRLWKIIKRTTFLKTKY